MSKGLKALIMLTTGIITEEQAKEYRHIVEKELKAFELILPLIERVDWIGDKYYLIMCDGHYIRITKKSYDLLKEVLLWKKK